MIENPVSDLNDITTSGKYFFSNGPSQKPVSSGWGFVLVLARPNNVCWQIWKSDDTNDIYSRLRKSNGTWLEWKQLAFTS